MNKKGLVAIEVLSIIFVPGMLTLFLSKKALNLLTKLHLKKVKCV